MPNTVFRVVSGVVMLFYVCFILFTFVFTLFICYVVASFIDDKPPFEASLVISPEIVEQGGIVTLTYENVNRYKICDYKRNYTIIVDNKFYWNSDEVSSSPATSTTGHLSDITTSFALDSSIPPGKADFYAIFRYTCPGNIVQSFRPYKKVFHQEIVIVPKQH